MLQHKRWEQAPVRLMKGSITPRKTLGKEEQDAPPVECYGFTKSTSPRESANLNWKTSSGSCRITSYFVPRLIDHKVKKTPSFFLPTLNVLASASCFRFLGLSAVVWSPSVTYVFLPFSPGSYTWKWRHLWIYFFFFYKLYIDVCFSQPEIFLIPPSHPWLFFTPYQVFNLRKGTLLSTVFWHQSLCHTELK